MSNEQVALLQPILNNHKEQYLLVKPKYYEIWNNKMVLRYSLEFSTRQRR